MAEVLITLGIIGIVAAMTLPSLIQKHQVKVTVTRLKKAYSILSQAHMRAVEENGPIESWGMGGLYEEESHKILGRNFSKYMNVALNCIDMQTDEVKKKCNPVAPESRYSTSVRLVDGTTFMYRVHSGNCKANYGTIKQLQNICGQITVDVNGDKRPDELGKDRFYFYVTKFGIYPAGSEFDTVITFKKYCDRNKISQDTNFNHGSACTAWVLYNENMDYLNCDDLDWNGKKTCGAK